MGPSDTTPPDTSRNSESDFDFIEEKFSRGGTAAALEALCQVLERDGKNPQLFEALLMRSRASLGMGLVPLATLADQPEDMPRPHEEAIAESCRRVGALYLDSGDIVKASPYFRALGETAPLAKALERVEPGSQRKDVEELIEIGFHQGIHPAHGLKLLLADAGICSSITAMERTPPAVHKVRGVCAGLLVKELYQEILESIRADVERSGKSDSAKDGPTQDGPTQDGPTQDVPTQDVPVPDTVRGFLEAHPKILDDGGYHADPSHVWSVVHLSSSIDGGPELEKALELAEYGSKLESTFQYKSEPPFEDFYADHIIDLRGRLKPGSADNEYALNHFCQKARTARERGEKHYPLGQILQLLARMGRAREAAHLLLEEEGSAGSGITPSLAELCQLAGEFRKLAEVSRERGDLLAFTAGLIQSKSLVEKQ